MSDDSNWMFVTNIHAGPVSILDRRAGMVKANIQIGLGPNGIVVCGPSP